MRSRGIAKHYHRLKSSVGSLWPIFVGAVFFGALFIASIFVFMALEQWTFVDSFYMVVITLSTVGFGEVHDMTPIGRFYTSILILFGVGNFAFIAGSFSQLLAEGKIEKFLWRRRVLKTIHKLRGHFIICGYGRTGGIVAREIRGEGHPVVVIENNPEVVAKLEEEGVLHLKGDATEDELLLSAGLEHAGALIAALSQDANNVYVVLTARQLNPDLHIVARANTESHIPRLERAGADRTVMPHMIGGVRMAQTVLRPNVTTFVELAVRGKIDLQMEELRVTPSSELAGKDLAGSGIRARFNAIVIGVKTVADEMIFNPAADYVLQVHDTLLIVGAPNDLQAMRELL